MTQKDLSEKSGISVPQIIRYESGKSKPRLGAALKLARALKMDAYDLMPELRKTTKELDISFPDDEYRLLAEQAEKLGLTFEELVRELVIFGIKGMARDPAIRAAIEKEKPGLAARVENMKDDDDLED